MLGDAFGEVAEKLRRSTVRVMGARRHLGSGVVSTEGRIVTNAHVVSSGGFEVELWNGRRVAAQIEKSDRRRDLAVLQVECDGLAHAAWGDSDALRPGELVIAVGSPFGFAGAVSTGVFHNGGVLPGTSQPWLVSNVRLAPGNSGGPLANARGEVVGINTMIAGGLALSVPSKSVARFLATDGGARPELGVTVRPVRLNPRGVQLGFLVLEVLPRSAAERASLMPGDVLLSAGQTSFHSVDDFQHALDTSPGGRLEIEFRRGASQRTRRVVARLDHPSPRAA
ncbi:MAG TPA: trypsin-like peptidase domain-containing protein [Bryobacteraceae bacterium]|nr:trypsin-like peptidase domain-containing protein [Bryobacteraceae bacterium]